MEEEIQKTEEFSLMNYFLSLLDRFMGKKPEYEKDKSFFEDEKNLYDKKGKLTPAYEQKIAEYEQYLKENNMTDFLKEEVSQDKTDQEVMDTICDYSDQRRILMADYEQVEKKKGRLFNQDKWVKDKIHVYGKSKEEKEQLSVLLQELLADYSDVALDDPDTREDIEKQLSELAGKEDNHEPI